MLILTRRDIERVITITDAIQVVRTAFVAASSGRVRIPVRTAIRVNAENVALFMPAARTDTPAVGLKIVTVYPGNRERNLPTIHAVVLLCNPETGRPEALLEGGLVTAYRTGAAGGLAADLLARKDVRTVAVFGAGVQGWHQIVALRAVRSIEQVRVVDVNRSAAESLAQKVKTELGIEASSVTDPESAVEHADVVVTATTSRVPVFNGNALSPGSHITAIGSFTPESRELDDTVLRRCDRIVVDSREAAWSEAGDLIIPRNAGWFKPERVDSEIGEIAAGVRPGRQTPDEVTLFKSVGVAVLDVAMAEVIVTRARAHGLGVEHELM